MKPEEKLKQLQLDIEAVMKTKPGRSVINWITKLAGLNQSSTARANFRTNETFFHEGERNICLQLEAELKAVCPDLFTTMKIEDLKND